MRSAKLKIKYDDDIKRIFVEVEDFSPLKVVFKGDIENLLEGAKKMQIQYFEIQNQNYYLKNEIKSVVKFMYLNLIENGIINNLGKMDFIFCRNVLIYFDVEMKKRVAELFYRILDDDGYLFLGYAETLSKVTDKFILTNFPEGSFYKKRL